MKELHPLPQLLYFLSVISGTLLLLHPLTLIAAFCAALAYYVCLAGWCNMLKKLFALLPFLLLAAIFNPLFNHRGVHILFYLPTGNPVTGESIAFGVAAVLMAAALLFQCFSFNIIFGSDKLISLIGKRFPRLCMLCMLIFSAVPRFIARFSAIIEAKIGIGEIGEKNVLSEKAYFGIAVFSTMFDRELENSFDLAAMLRARGYGLGGRTSYGLYCFNRQDAFFLALLLLCDVLLIIFSVANVFAVSFFPVFSFAEPQGWQLFGYFTYGLLLFLPILTELEEVIKWRFLSSKI